ncbi:hypothetical protein DPMN_192547 [Dreissena polymorpha]|uniref:Uncharacterized protein n=1 Tax=Dreissena polymorpha TaxID=45954 RepID=A0A9D3Y5V1_DREPO|nr:hypothetical protein DPMN_192547 [Dreissena polymorpha]
MYLPMEQNDTKSSARVMGFLVSAIRTHRTLWPTKQQAMLVWKGLNQPLRSSTSACFWYR